MAPLRVRVVALLAILTLVVGARFPVVSAAAQTAPADPVAALTKSIDATLNDPVLSKASWSVAIASLDRSEPLYRRSADKLLMPASTMKVVTLAVAAEALGWDFTYATTLYRLGAVENGTLEGDLLITGTGDPSFDDWDGQASTRFAEWATRLKEAGITRVTGRVIGDDNAFEEPGLGNGWAWDDVGASYATGVGALQFNENTAQLVISPGLAKGDRPHIEVRPATAMLDLRNLATTGTDGGPLLVQPRPRSTVLEITGAIAPGSPAIVRNVSVANPTLYFATAARAALVANGISINGGAIDVDDLPSLPERATAVAVADFQSPPLRILAATMMKLSQNLFAESLLKTLAPDGTAAGGREHVKAILAGWGIDLQDVVMVDGSGLSRYNLLTADAQLAVLAHVHSDIRLRSSFVEALPLVGVDGTLERRMTGTRAEKNARAKTGSFSNARGLTGFVTSADGEALAFSLLANNYNAANGSVDRAMDAIVVALAQFTRR